MRCDLHDDYLFRLVAFELRRFECDAQRIAGHASSKTTKRTTVAGHQWTVTP